MAPSAVLAGWMQKPEAERKEAEAKMMSEWDAWTASHKDVFADIGGGVGKTVRVTKAGSADTKNDIMLYTIAQGDSQEAVAKIFEGHPHFGIPEASIEIMELHAMRGQV